ncbi:MAG: hypothetical protein ACK56F_07465, partial [bacterium]
MAIQPGFVRSKTAAPLASKMGLRLPRMLAPAKIIVKTLVDSLSPSGCAGGSLTRMASGLAAKEKPLRSEV